MQLFFSGTPVCVWPWVTIFLSHCRSIFLPSFCNFFFFYQLFCCITKAYFCMYPQWNFIYFCLKTYDQPREAPLDECVLLPFFDLQKQDSRLCGLFKKPAWRGFIHRVCRIDIGSGVRFKVTLIEGAQPWPCTHNTELCKWRWCKRLACQQKSASS